MKKLLIVVFFFLFINILFFLSLLYPHLKLIITPEYTGGDLQLVMYPYLKFMCDAVKDGFPFWSRHLGFGYPLYAEHMMVIFNPFVSLFGCRFGYEGAFISMLISYVLLAQIGLYLLAREWKLSMWSGLYLAVAVPFIPIIVSNYMHPIMAPALYIFPLLLWGVMRVINTLTLHNVFILSIIIVMQLASGYAQNMFISSIAVLCFGYFYSRFVQKAHYIKTFGVIIASYIIAFFLGALLSFPMLEFILNSSRNFSSQSLAIQFDQNATIKTLLTLFNPYINGKVQDGSYLHGYVPDFWEGTLFIYTIPLILLCLSFFQKKNRSIFLSIFSVSIILFIIGLGRNSPIYFIHALPPFSMFRFPTRFFQTVAMILAISSVFGFETILRMIRTTWIKRIFVIFILVTIFIEARLFFYSFHVLESPRVIYQKTSIVSYLQKHAEGRIYSLHSNLENVVSRYSLKGYSSSNNNSHKKVLQGLSGNIPLMFGIKTAQNNSHTQTPQLRRYSYLTLLFNQYDIKPDNSIEFMDLAKNAYVSSGIEYILSTQKISNTWVSLVLTERINQNTVYLYKNKLYKGRFIFYSKINKVQTLQDVYRGFSNLHKKNTVLIENKNISLHKTKSMKNKATIVKDTNAKVSVKTFSDTQSIGVLTDAYYPGWKVYIDGKEASLLKADYFFRGVVVPEGTHIITFTYTPILFYLGLVSTIVTFTTLIVIGKKSL